MTIYDKGLIRAMKAAYYQEDFLASHSVQPGSAEARRMTVISGRKCCELYRKSGPLWSLVRTLLVSSAWRSTRCYLTWKASATPARRLLFRLVPSMPRTEETGSQLWPTIRMSEYKGCGPYWSKSANHNLRKKYLTGTVISHYRIRHGGILNPKWAEWLMGFPLGWTDLSASETPSSTSSSTQYSGQ